MQDSNGVIDLDIPIDRELSQLHVGITDLIITAPGKGITITVTPSLAYTVLGPAGALAFVGAKVSQSLLRTELPILECEPGIRELSEEHGEILKKVDDKTQDNEEMTYSIYAKVTHDKFRPTTPRIQERKQYYRMRQYA